ncbi:hypothetical protein BD309DRAFT_975903 [Dichomitus squalens]|nr:hypothetical protein BD309DRAFT_975903 [Dichomitus squalens]
MSRDTLGEAEEIEANPSSVRWSDYSSWFMSLNTEKMAFILATKKLTVELGLEWAAPSHYFLRVNIVTETLPVESSTSLELAQGTQAEGSGAGGDAGEQDIGAEAGASAGGVLQPDDALLPMQHSDDTTGPL